MTSAMLLVVSPCRHTPSGMKAGDSCAFGMLRKMLSDEISE